MFNIEKNKLFFIAGPCQIESLDHAVMMASRLKDICEELEVPLIYKSSFDKANRSSYKSARGIGLEKGLEILSHIKQKFQIPVLTDIHESYQAELAAHAGIDILQIPAFLCRQTDLLVAAGETGKWINVKKGQFLAPADMKNVADKISSTGNNNIMLCERGATHGYNNLVVDMRSFPIMASTGYTVVYDATHSVQQPGSMGTSSGGDRSMVSSLARSAVASGYVNGVFIECHQDPDNAPSDGPNMIDINNMLGLMHQLITIHQCSTLFV